MTSKDAKFFNCSEKHEVDRVCKKYENPEAVKEFIKAKAAEGVIKYWTHEKLADYLAENGFKFAPKADKMTMATLVGKVHEKCGLSKADSDKVLDALLESIKEALVAGDSITLQGFGVFKVVQQAARKGKNPQTGAEIDIPERKAVKFTPAKALKDEVAGRQG